MIEADVECPVTSYPLDITSCCTRNFVETRAREATDPWNPSHIVLVLASRRLQHRASLVVPIGADLGAWVRLRPIIDPGGGTVGEDLLLDGEVREGLQGKEMTRDRFGGSTLLVEMFDPAFDIGPGEPGQIILTDKIGQLAHDPASLVDGLGAHLSPCRPFRDQIVALGVVELDRQKRRRRDWRHRSSRCVSRRKVFPTLDRSKKLAGIDFELFDHVEDTRRSAVPVLTLAEISARSLVVKDAALPHQPRHRVLLFEQLSQPLRIAEEGFGAISDLVGRLRVPPFARPGEKLTN